RAGLRQGRAARGRAAVGALADQFAAERQDPAAAAAVAGDPVRRRPVMPTRRVLTALLTAVALPGPGSGSFTGTYDSQPHGGAGPADLGGDPNEVKIQFRDVLDLVPQTHVKINEVTVGRVEKVDLADDGWHAEVTVLLRRDADMPANALANIKQSSLLGEKYID